MHYAHKNSAESKHYIELTLMLLLIAGSGEYLRTWSKTDLITKCITAIKKKQEGKNQILNNIKYKDIVTTILRFELYQNH